MKGVYDMGTRNDAILIIEDQFEMVQIIQHYLNTLNKSITKENVFCFYIHEDIAEIKSIAEMELIEGIKYICFKGRQKEVKEKLNEFLKSHNDDRVFVLIDVLLNSLDASMPTYQKYKQDAEYSDQIYMELLNGLYNEAYQKVNNINPESFDFALYSRSSASRSIVAKLLKEYYENMKKDMIKENEENEKKEEADKKTEKRDAFIALNIPFYQTKNINWIKNRCEGTTADGKVKAEDPPLALERSLIQYIQNEMFI